MPTNSLPYLANDSAAQTAFHHSFDRTAFAFSHRLHSSGYFTYEALRSLADRVSRKPNRWYVEEGKTRPQNGWSSRPSDHTLLETLDDITDNHSLVMLKRIHEEPDYRPILDTLREELSQLTGIDIASEYTDGLMTVLITSPLRVTPYHMDGDSNLLMQMSGDKSVYIFNGADREILPAEELEGFWSGDVHAVRYKEHLQHQAWRFNLSPGNGVANPVTFPHWVQNGSEVSISLSTNFKRRINDAADAYRVNRQLRRFGLRPAAPGAAPRVDHAKGAVYRTARWMKRRLERRPGASA